MPGLLGETGIPTTTGAAVDAVDTVIRAATTIVLTTMANMSRQLLGFIAIDLMRVMWIDRGTGDRFDPGEIIFGYLVIAVYLLFACSVQCGRLGELFGLKHCYLQ
jgi:hypothetical protein